ncbi:class I SAM-dependent methyltransferase [Hamadaea sp. NPDC051192]|uniref:class I SAM-dependent methyltransferase n=1 Tax=Hamadaea sp. NPDC051192 TaxID=3154940 RepID=UPI00343F9A39
MSRLLDAAALEASSVVANNAMNRERGLAGVNSYTRDLGFDPVAYLASTGGSSWLDLCCGRGRALIEASAGFAGRIVGVDLVDFFDPVPPGRSNLRLTVASLHEWQPDGAFDLITCVHGLHYVGDKLGVLRRAVGWLAPGGRFAANLDLASVKGVPGVARALRGCGLTYDARRKLIGCAGPVAVELPYEYQGADDEAGPNYTGQPAVDSYYRLAGGDES